MAEEAETSPCWEHNNCGACTQDLDCVWCSGDDGDRLTGYCVEGGPLGFDSDNLEARKVRDAAAGASSSSSGSASGTGGAGSTFAPVGNFTWNAPPTALRVSDRNEDYTCDPFFYKQCYMRGDAFGEVDSTAFGIALFAVLITIGCACCVLLCVCCACPHVFDCRKPKGKKKKGDDESSDDEEIAVRDARLRSIVMNDYDAEAGAASSVDMSDDQSFPSSSSSSDGPDYTNTESSAQASFTSSSSDSFTPPSAFDDSDVSLDLGFDGGSGSDSDDSRGPPPPPF